VLRGLMTTGANKPPPGAEVYFECKLRGELMQVNAIDATTGTEVSVFGPAKARAVLIHNATTKLAYVMKKKAKGE
jgi:hypothetical protein